MTTTTITKGVLTAIQRDVLTALAKVEADYGVKFKTGKSHYSNGATGDILLNFATLDEQGEAQIDANTKSMMGYHDLTDEWCRWPTTMRSAGHPGAWRITGYNSRAPKYPWVCTQRDTGKTFRLPNSLAKVLFSTATRIPFDPPVVQAPAAQAQGNSSSGSGDTVHVAQAQKKPAREYEGEF